MRLTKRVHYAKKKIKHSHTHSEHKNAKVIQNRQYAVFQIRYIILYFRMHLAKFQLKTRRYI